LWDDVGLEDQDGDKYEYRCQEWLKGADHERINDWAKSAGIEQSEAPKSPEMMEIPTFYERASDSRKESYEETAVQHIETRNEDEEKRRKEEDSCNQEMMESLRARSMFLRTFEVEEGEERFGDEADS
jgi:hypothetical protein